MILVPNFSALFKWVWFLILPEKILAPNLFNLLNVNSAILDPRDTYTDAAEWTTKATDLASRFIKNFAQYTDNEQGQSLVKAGPSL